MCATKLVRHYHASLDLDAAPHLETPFASETILPVRHRLRHRHLSNRQPSSLAQPVDQLTLMWRDRTNLFVAPSSSFSTQLQRANRQPTPPNHCSYISYRQSYSHRPAKRSRFTDGRSAFANGHGHGPGHGHGSNGGDDDDRRGLLSAVDSLDDGDSGSDVVVEMDRLPPRWADLSDEVTELLASIARKSAQLEQLHGKHVLPGFFDDRGDRLRAQEEGQIERLTADITADFHACQDRIRRIGGLLQSDACASPAHLAMGHNLQVSLATRVQDSSTRFRKKQSAYLKSLSPSPSLPPHQHSSSIHPRFVLLNPPSSAFILYSASPAPLCLPCPPSFPRPPWPPFILPLGPS